MYAAIFPRPMLAVTGHEIEGRTFRGAVGGFSADGTTALVADWAWRVWTLNERFDFMALAVHAA